MFNVIGAPPAWYLSCGGPLKADGFSHEEDARGWACHAMRVQVRVVGDTSATREYDAVMRLRDALEVSVSVDGFLWCAYAARLVPINGWYDMTVGSRPSLLGKVTSVMVRPLVDVPIPDGTTVVVSLRCERLPVAT